LEEGIYGNNLDHIAAATAAAAIATAAADHWLPNLQLSVLPLLLSPLPLLLLLPCCHQPRLHGSQVAVSLCSSSGRGSSRRLPGMLPPLLLRHAVQRPSGCLAAAQVVPLQAVHGMNGHVGACRCEGSRSHHALHKKNPGNAWNPALPQGMENFLLLPGSRGGEHVASSHASPNHPPTDAVAQQDQRGAPGG
jgi:hypothetical protein